MMEDIKQIIREINAGSERATRERILEACSQFEIDEPTMDTLKGNGWFCCCTSQLCCWCRMRLGLCLILSLCRYNANDFANLKLVIESECQCNFELEPAIELHAQDAVMSVPEPLAMPICAIE